jgi:hypothetical protein
MVANTLPVIPAKAGIQGAEIEATALGPRFRGGDDKWLVISGSFSVRYLSCFAQVRVIAGARLDLDRDMA